MDLGPVGAGIEPVLLGVAGDAVGAGADITAAVELMPDRRRELEDVDLVAHQDVLEHGPGVDDLVGDEARLFEIGVAIGLAQLPFGELVRKAERHVAAGAREHVQEQAEPLGAAGNVVEHDAGAILGAQDRFRREADVLLPGGAAHGADLAELIGQREPFAQVVIGDAGLEIAACVHPCRPVLCGAYDPPPCLRFRDMF